MVSPGKLIGILVLMISCTQIQKRPPVKLDKIVFNKAEPQGLILNKKIKIKYRTCYTSREGENFDHFKPLKDEFLRQFKVQLEGLGKISVDSFVVKDSSIFVPNERCDHIEAYPLLKTSLTGVKEQEFSVDDKRGHVH